MKSIGKTIWEWRIKNHMTQAQLAAELKTCGVSANQSSVGAWEREQSAPSAPQLLALCKVLGITDIYSAFIDINPDQPFAGLNDKGKKKVLEYIELLKLSDQYRIKETEILNFPTREIRLFNLPASAGHGEFLDSDDYTQIEVGAEVPKTADFGIRIQGDSMEPRFIDGQIVFVQRTEALESGEIGIFCLNGSAYCKKILSTEDGSWLVSLNTTYAPIPVTENDSFLTFGRVVG